MQTVGLFGRCMIKDAGAGANLLWECEDKPVKTMLDFYYGYV